MNRRPTEETGDIEEEAEYVNVAVSSGGKTAANSGKKFCSFTWSFLPMTVILIAIMASRIYCTSVISEKKAELTAENQELKTQMQHLINQTTHKNNVVKEMENLIANLTAENQELETLMQHLINQTTHENNVKKEMENLIANLTAENQELETLMQHLINQTTHENNVKKEMENLIANLTAENRELKTQRDNLTGQIEGWKEQVKETKQQTEEWKKQNLSRVQWSIDQYCPINNDDVRNCSSCQEGWLAFESSCYAINDPPANRWLTWKEAQADCEGKSWSELAVIFNKTDKDFISRNSWSSTGTNGYWIGLRVEDGKWKWVDGSDLTESSWIQPPSPDEGYCAISVQNEGLKSVNCSDKNRWFCQKKAVSLKRLP